MFEMAAQDIFKLVTSYVIPFFQILLIVFKPKPLNLGGRTFCRDNTNTWWVEGRKAGAIEVATFNWVFFSFRILYCLVFVYI